MTTHGSFEAFCPKRVRISRNHAARECYRGGSARLGEQLLVSLSENDVPDGAVRERAIVEGVTWGHWLRRSLTSGRTVGGCTLMSGLSSVLKGVLEVHGEEYCCCRGHSDCIVVI